MTTTNNKTLELSLITEPSLLFRGYSDEDYKNLINNGNDRIGIRIENYDWIFDSNIFTINESYDDFEWFTNLANILLSTLVQKFDSDLLFNRSLLEYHFKDEHLKDELDEFLKRLTPSNSCIVFMLDDYTQEYHFMSVEKMLSGLTNISTDNELRATSVTIYKNIFEQGFWSKENQPKDSLKIEIPVICFESIC